ncbi:hypothetical protein WJX73_001964 [Symbiochloris irregularis]|uniref:7,8-dihydroneopterin aldolase n=1 Tax=Symbiochloris irregularis TaxID=706552 RepID=A0AAW1P9T4_9CHLO
MFRCLRQGQRITSFCSSRQSLLRRLITSEPADRLLLRGLVFTGYHGVLPEENVLGQKFVVDADLSCDLRKAGLTDDLDATVSYADVYRLIKSIVEGKPRKLVEAVAEDIAAQILAQHTRVHAVNIHICKPHVAVEGVVDSLGVEIMRARR